jgi:type I restriction enzyme, S subunit
MKPGQRVPLGWQAATLQDLVFFQRGYDITKAEQKTGDIPVVSSSGINSYHSESKTDGPGVVIGRKGSLGTVHYTQGPYWPHDTTLWSKDLKGNLPRFVYYFIHILDLGRYDTGNSNPTLNRNHIHGIDITIPDLRSQEKITGILSAYDDLIENNLRRIRLLEESARLLYREWFVHFRFPGHEHVKIVDGVPEGWEKQHIGDFCTKIGSGATPRGGASSYQTSGITLIRSLNIYNYNFHDDGLVFINEQQASKLSNVIVKSGDVLINITGASVARCCLVPKRHLPARVNQHVMIMRPDSSTVCSEYLMYAINSKGQKQFILNIAGAGGATREALTKDTITNLSLLIPDHMLMKEFCIFTSENFSQIETLQKQNNKLRAARDILLPRLMNGEIAV